MSDYGRLLDESEMRLLYGSFYELGGRVSLDRAKIPQELWGLMPYAAFWGIADDKRRDNLVMQAPSPVRANLKAVAQAFDDLLDVWLAGPEAFNATPTSEYVAFSAMRMAADFA